MGWKEKRTSSIFKNKSQNFRIWLILQCITEILILGTQKITEFHFLFRLRYSFARVSNKNGCSTQVKRLEKLLITFRNSNSILNLQTRKQTS